MKRTFVFIAVLFTFSCGSKTNRETERVFIKSTPETFENIFLQIDSFGISSEIVKTPINISIANGKIVICDYESDSVDLFDNKGKFILAITNRAGTPKKLVKPICTFCKDDTIFIASNHGRRILTYVLKNDSSASLIHSFIISQSNITPIDMTGFGNNIIMAGFNMQTDQLLHMYTDEGKFEKSFMSSSDLGDNTLTQSALNYPFVDYMNGYIYAIEHSVYRISKFDRNGNEILKKEIRPDYYVAPDPDSLNHKKNNYFEHANLYSWPIELKATSGYVFTQLQMPGPVTFSTPEDYFEQSHFKMDVFNKNCEPVYTGIDCENKKLAAIDQNIGTFYFIAGYSSETKSYIIKTYSLKI